MDERLEYIDKLYEVSLEAFGVPMGHALCDRRVLYPRALVPGRLALYEHSVPVEDLDRMAEAGWFAWLPGAGTNRDELGVPIYVVDRIELFLQLRAKGWQDDELRDYAESEEWLVDGCLLEEDWDYTDDDAEVVVRQLSDELDVLNQEQVWRKPPTDRPPEWTRKSWSSEVASLSDEELGAKIERQKRTIRRISGHNVEEMPEPLRAATKKQAFRIRCWQDMIRAMMLSNERAPLIAGYSRAVQLEPPEGPRPMMIDSSDPDAFGRINWAATVHDHYLMERFDEAILRVPGFVLQGDRITHKVLPPLEYERLCRQYDLQEYLNVRAVIRGERRCAHCSAALSAEASSSRRYCTEKCSQAARQKAYRYRKKKQVLRETMSRRDAPFQRES